MTRSLRLWLAAVALLVGFSGVSIFTRPEVPVASAIPLALGGNANVYNVTHFGSVQAALDAIPAGSKLYFPSASGPYQPPDTSGWHIHKSVEIFGDWLAGGEATALNPYNFSKDGSIFQLHSSIRLPDAGVSGVYIHDLVFTSTAPPGTGGVGDYIRFAEDTTWGTMMIERCKMLYAGRSAIYFAGYGYIVGLTMRDCTFYGCGGHGAYINLGALISMSGCSFSSNHGMGMVMVNPGNGTSISACNFESNGDRLAAGSTQTFPEMFGVDYNAQVLLENGDCSFTGCNIEDTSANPTFAKHGMTLNACHGIFLGGNEIDTGSIVAGAIGINIINGTRGCTVAANIVAGFPYAVKIDGSTTQYGNCILPQYVPFPAAGQEGLVSVPNGSYNFAVITNQSATGSTNKVVGLLLPNLATNGNQPDSLTDAYPTILQTGLLAAGGDSLFLRKSTGAWKLVR